MKLTEIVLASHNSGKLAELSHMLHALPIQLIPQSTLGIADIPETGLTFIENAILKARHAAKLSGKAALADDSGLVINALAGKPGIYSARYAGEPSNAANNIKKILAEMQSVPASKRQATFYCILAFLRHEKDPAPLLAEGVWHGTIATEVTGMHGFGYDPIFYLPSLQKTAAELTTPIKNKISHRAMALKSLLAQLTDQL